MSGAAVVTLFENLLLGSAFGRLFACNLIDYAASPRCHPAARVQLHEWLDLLRQLHRVRGLADDPPGSALQTYLANSISAKALKDFLDMSAVPVFTLPLADGMTIWPSKLATVVTLDVIEFIAERGWINRQKRHGVRIPRNPSSTAGRRKLAKLATLPPVESRFRLAPGKSLGRKLVWLTPCDPLEAFIGGHPDAADRARDRLGLVHLRRGQALIMLKLDAAVVSALQTGRPTPSDAGVHRRYRWQKGPAWAEGAWGGTIDLERLYSRHGSIVGAAERVSQPIDAGNMARGSGTIEFALLGLVQASRGDIDGALEDVDRYFAGVVQGRRSDAVLRRRIVAI